MRVLQKRGSFVGGVGLLLLSMTNTEILIRDVQKKICVDCGLPLGLHAIVDAGPGRAAGVTCPDTSKMKVGVNPARYAD